LDAYLAPDLVLVSYLGSPAVFTLTPTAGGLPIDDLGSYDEVTFSLWSGSRESPGEEALSVTLAGPPPNYITVGTDPDSNPCLVFEIPGTAMGNLEPGAYYSELWVTPPGGEPTFMGWAEWHHETSTYTP